MTDLNSSHTDIEARRQKNRVHARNSRWRKEEVLKLALNSIENTNVIMQQFAQLQQEVDNLKRDNYNLQRKHQQLQLQNDALSYNVAECKKQIHEQFQHMCSLQAAINFTMDTTSE